MDKTWMWWHKLKNGLKPDCKPTWVSSHKKNNYKKQYFISYLQSRYAEWFVFTCTDSDLDFICGSICKNFIKNYQESMSPLLWKTHIHFSQGLFPYPYQKVVHYEISYLSVTFLEICQYCWKTEIIHIYILGLTHNSRKFEAREREKEGEREK